MQRYMHVIPGMDAAAADEVVALILGADEDDLDELMEQKWTQEAKDEPGIETHMGKSPGQPLVAGAVCWFRTSRSHV